MGKRLLVLVALVAVVAAGCNNGGSAKKETAIVRQQQSQFLTAQPIPQFNSSQLRQNLIEIETAQANSTATTSFMFLRTGAGTTGPLVHWCPSIGFPIPATYQLTAPQGKLQNNDLVVPQLEATGVYTGDTSGTYVICIDKNGKPYAFLHEGDVSTITGPAHWDNALGEIVIDGAPTGNFTAK